MKKTNKTLAFFLVLAFVFSTLLIPTPCISAAENAWAGSGTKSSPYIISNEADLKKLAENVTAGNGYGGVYFKMGTDITLTNDWTPIGSGKVFFGVFDGNGKTIKGLTINKQEYGIALFSCVGEDESSGFYGEIKNLTIDSPNITGSTAVGAIVGQGNRARITNCKVTGNGKIKGGAMVGGIVGHGGAIIDNCVNEVTVEGRISIGGIQGNTSNSIISNCQNKGDVIGTGWGDITRIGGIAGNNNGKITNCQNSGKVSGGSEVGGITGGSGNSPGEGCVITDCRNTGNVSGEHTIGGIVGKNEGVGVIKCENTGKVSGNGDNVGGIVGYNTAWTVNKQNHAAVVSDCVNSGSVTGKNHADGIVGLNDPGNKIVNCLAVPSDLSSWAVSDVQSAIALGIATKELQAGYQSNTTRAEFCRAAVNFLEIYYKKNISDILKERSLTPTNFADTPDSAIAAAAALGITSGTDADKNLFSPNLELTREQAATMLKRTLDIIGVKIESKSAAWTDTGAISSWAVDPINSIYSAGVMSGTSTTSLVFSPKSPYTHEQSIVTFNRLYNFAGKAEVIGAGNTNTIVDKTMEATPQSVTVQLSTNKSTVITLPDGLKDAEWTSSDPYIVSVDQNGKVTGLHKGGKASITAKTAGAVYVWDVQNTVYPRYLDDRFCERNQSRVQL